MRTASDLLKLVDADREARGMSHTGYAVFLGISKTYWTRLRTGQRRPSISFLKSLKARLPDLRPQIEDYHKTHYGLAETDSHNSANRARRGQKNGIKQGGDR